MHILYIKRIIRSVIIASAGASNRLEGNRLSDQEVERIYDQLCLQKLISRGYIPIEHIFSPKQLALWQWIQQEAPEEFTRKDAIVALGFHPRTIEESIKKLLTLKRLEIRGEGRATRYKRAISHNLT